MRKIVLALLLLTGCTTNFTSPKEAADSCERFIDNFTKTNAVNLESEQFEFDNHTVTKRLTYLLNSPLAYSATLDIKIHNWRFLDSCFTDSGEELITKKLDSQVVAHNWVNERLLIILPKNTLEPKAGKGLSVKCIGSRGNIVIDFSANEITGFLQCVDKYKNQAGN